MADLRAVDIRLVLGRLRPGCAYHWRGGEGYAAIGEWRDPATKKPTEAEILAEWVRYQNEMAVARQEQAARREKLERLRAENAADLDVAKFGGEAALDELARKIAWLEQEIRDLRNEK
ncbi:MAG: hypothetical protein HXY41_04110 [Chloroflexi bacterium]|nr:hypothetical protein [Chloroflexota bacterium]